MGTWDGLCAHSQVLTLLQPSAGSGTTRRARPGSQGPLSTGLEPEPGAGSQARTRGCRRAGTLGIPEGSSWDSQAVVAAEMLEGDLGMGKGQGRVRHEPSWCQILVRDWGGNMAIFMYCITPPA